MYHGRRRFLAVFTIPPLALYVIFVLSPYAQAFYLSLTDWRGYSSQAKFVGFDNFRKLFDDDAFWAALKNNAVMLVVIPAATVALALLLAGLLNFGGRQRGAGLSPVRGANIYRILFFFPQLLSVSIVGVLFQFVYTENGGLLNGVLKAVGLGSLTQDWMGDSHIALFSVMAVIIWSGMGFYVVLFNAAMQSIPSELLEAAALDGAGKFSAFFRITLPLMWERVQVALVALGIVALDGFAFVQIMTGEPPGGPDNSTTVLGVPLYENAFQYGRFGYATAFGVALFFLTMSMAVLTFRLSRRDRVEY